MNMHAINSVRTSKTADLLLTHVGTEGSASHAYLALPDLTSGREALRNMADAAHYLCVLHGRVPGVIDHALTRTQEPIGREWLERSAEAFGIERALLTRLAVATGPLPSTPGQAQCDTAVLQQRHALEMLALSDRAGCALGAAVALVLDWAAVRTVLEAAARRVSIAPSDCTLPPPDETCHVVDAVATSVGVERAMRFGAQQLLAQHRGLWDLLGARQAARAQQ